MSFNFKDSSSFHSKQGHRHGVYSQRGLPAAVPVLIVSQEPKSIP